MDKDRRSESDRRSEPNTVLTRIWYQFLAENLGRSPRSLVFGFMVCVQEQNAVQEFSWYFQQAVGLGTNTIYPNVWWSWDNAVVYFKFCFHCTSIRFFSYQVLVPLRYLQCTRAKQYRNHEPLLALVTLVLLFCSTLLELATYWGAARAPWPPDPCGHPRHRTAATADGGGWMQAIFCAFQATLSSPT